MVCAHGLSIGCDFAGLETPIWALKVLNVDFKHVVSCDTSVASRKISRHLGVEHCDSDINDRRMPGHVDVYVFGPPCQPFSKCGKGLGVDDPENGLLVLKSMMYVIERKPGLILMEQVPTVKTGKHREIWDAVIAVLTELGYHLTVQTLQSNHFGVPQNRERVYLMGALQAGGFEVPYPPSYGPEHDRQALAPERVPLVPDCAETSASHH